MIDLLFIYYLFTIYLWFIYITFIYHSVFGIYFLYMDVLYCYVLVFYIKENGWDKGNHVLSLLLFDLRRRLGVVKYSLTQTCIPEGKEKVLFFAFLSVSRQNGMQYIFVYLFISLLILREFVEGLIKSRKIPLFVLCVLCVKITTADSLRDRQISVGTAYLNYVAFLLIPILYHPVLFLSLHFLCFICCLVFLIHSTTSLLQR